MMCKKMRVLDDKSVNLYESKNRPLSKKRGVIGNAELTFFS